MAVQDRIIGLMSDVTIERGLAAMEAAAEHARLSLLFHADAHGAVRPADGKRYVTLRPGTGTPQFHIRKLTDAGLLVRVARGQYCLSSAGTLLIELIRLLATTPAAASHDPEHQITVRIHGSNLLDTLLPEGATLVADLQRQLAGGDTTASRLHVERGAAR